MVQSPIAATGPDGHDPVPSAGNLAGQDGFPWHVGDPPDPLGALCVRTGGGDHAAFAALHDALAGSVTSFTRRGWIRSEQAERITDAVFVEVWNLARLQPSDGDVEVWIAAVAHRRIGDRNRFHFHSHHCGRMPPCDVRRRTCSITTASITATSPRCWQPGSRSD